LLLWVSVLNDDRSDHKRHMHIPELNWGRHRLGSPTNSSGSNICRFIPLVVFFTTSWKQGTEIKPKYSCFLRLGDINHRLVMVQLVPFRLLMASFQLEHRAIAQMLANSANSGACVLIIAITRSRCIATGANLAAFYGRNGFPQNTALFVLPQVIYPMLAVPHACLADSEAVFGRKVLIVSMAAVEASEFGTAND
jgi:hypothetical protein